VRFLVDQAVSPQVAHALCVGGHDAVHVRDIGLAAASDLVIIERAFAERRAVITQDTDYGTLLIKSGARRPSVVLLRVRDGRPEVHARLLLSALKLASLARDLESGAIVVLSEATIRIRRLA
jgi:predicted nuclease of predicted toxin-antitoxin system